MEKELKTGMLKNEKMGDYELEQGYASYRTIISRFIGDIVLCNNIIDVDESIFENMKGELGEDVEIFQYYLCHIGQWEEEQLLKAGVILSYSDVLDCDVLCVDHFGTSWDYVLTDVKLFDTYEDLKKYEEE